MNYIIMAGTQLYTNPDKKVIVFDSIEDANNFLNGFFHYSMLRMIQENPLRMGEVIAVQNQTTIEEINLNDITYSYIKYADLKK